MKLVFEMVAELVALKDHAWVSWMDMNAGNRSAERLVTTKVVYLVSLLAALKVEKKVFCEVVETVAPMAFCSVASSDPYEAVMTVSWLGDGVVE